MEALGLIPARGGSRSIPRKNLVLLSGRPLLAYTCEAALQAKGLARAILSTDHEETAEVGREFGVEVPFLRPAELTRDETPMVDVMRHAIAWLEENERFRPEVIVLLQPTSPLRRGDHIDAALKIMAEGDADTVVTVVEIPHQFNPVSALRMKEGKLVPFGQDQTIFRRQDKPKAFARNGPAVLAVRREVIESGRLYGEAVYPLEMSLSESVDIDDYNDLALAEFWLTRRRA